MKLFKPKHNGKRVSRYLIKIMLLNSVVSCGLMANNFMSLFYQLDFIEFIFIITALLASLTINGILLFFGFYLWFKQVASFRVIFLLSWLFFSVLQFALLVDGLVYQKMSIHSYAAIGYDWSFMKMGMEEMLNDFSSEGLIGFISIVGLEYLCLRFLLPLRKKWKVRRFSLNKIGIWSIVAVLGLCIIIDKAIYASAVFNDDKMIKRIVNGIPLYQKLGFQYFFVPKGAVDSQTSNMEHSAVIYPLRSLKLTNKVPHNLVWINLSGVSNKERQENLVPALDEIAKDALDFKHHYLLSENREENIFSMLYGLFPSYYSQFYKEMKTPLLYELLREQGYKTNAFFSNDIQLSEVRKMSFFDAFQPISSPNKLESNYKVSQFFKGWTLSCTDAVAFGVFLDFDVASFPVVYSDEAYAPSNAKPNLVHPELFDEGVNNAYKNALGKQSEILFDLWSFLQQKDWFENTIVVISCLGEDDQIRNWSKKSYQQFEVPLLIIAPNQPAKSIEQYTQHTDIVPTLLSLLGYSTKSAYYSNGVNVLKPSEERYFAFWMKDSVRVIDEFQLQNKPEKVEYNSKLNWFSMELRKFLNESNVGSPN